MDLRVQKTLNAIHSAIKKLLITKGFDRLTVKDICDEANIRRVTFYCYYQDKYDLMNKLIEEWFNRVYNERKEKDDETFNQYFYSIVESSLNELHIEKENVSIFNNSKNFKEFQNKLKECIFSHLKEKATTITRLNDNDKYLLVLIYSNCYVSLIENHVKNISIDFNQLIKSMNVLLKETPYL